MTAPDLETLVRTHQAEIYRYLRYLGAHEPAEAEDLAQETFLAAYRSRNAPDLGQDRLAAAWLRGIARNLFLAHCRRARGNPVHADTSMMERAEQVWSSRFLRQGDGFDYLEALRGCLRKLQPRAREALAMRYERRLSRKDMARELGIGLDGVKSLLQRLRAALAECVRQVLAGQGGDA